jgi:uncharacterized spore protein YtfJ
VRGEPYHIGGRELIPVVRIVALGKARATIGTNHTGGWAGGAVWMKPLAVLEQTPQGERRIAITDKTAAAIRSLLAIVVILAFVPTALRWLRYRLHSAKASA